MPAAELFGVKSPEKLSIVVFSGDFDRIHYALVMAAGALASNRAVTLFFTMWAARALQGDDGWRRLKASDGRDGADFDADLIARGIGGFAELLEACVALGATIMVCEMGLKALGLEPATLRADLALTPGGIVTFLADASRDGAMVFI